ncbi:MAG: glutamate synthase large subunit [Alphaproteobacteria bacterium]|nr:glutamate synthase large subunit [Alphaproteobacteria bacterium]QQS56343.1 MAG: glutamate synthase large subunit [Alphaproteobacteria bacterium]
MDGGSILSPSTRVPEEHHDACGVGFLAKIDGTPSHGIVKDGLTMLGCVQHRGGINPDGSGDGAGIQTQIPHGLVNKAYYDQAGFEAAGSLGVGVFFLPRQDWWARDQAQKIVTDHMQNAGYKNTIWRDVPVDKETLSTLARQTMPHIMQLLVPPQDGMKGQDFEKHLFVVRRQIEKDIAERGLSRGGSETFYVPSMSSQRIIYKGMALAPHLSKVFPDLKDDSFKSAYIIFHNRFSTNTMPEWPLAHPFRMLAHNGEVNTVVGNRNAMPMHARRFADAYGPDYAKVTPVIIRGRSDSADADSAMEYFRHTGLSLPTIKSMMAPEAVRSSSQLPDDVRDMYKYIYATYDQWDGPAMFIVSDGNMVLAAGDRNGLRPTRYIITNDGRMIAGSEDDMLTLDPSLIVEKGNLTPGTMIAVDLGRKQVLRDQELKAIAVSELRDQIELTSYIQDVPDPKRPFAFRYDPDREEDGKALRQAQRTAGITTEDVEYIDDMVKEGKDPLGAMGDDTPLAVLSEKRRHFTDFFQEQFAQITNPPIDPIREAESMSISSHLGSLHDSTGRPSRKPVFLLNETPILSEQHKRDLQDRIGKQNLHVIDCTFDTSRGESLRSAMDRILGEAASAAHQGKHIFLTDEFTNEHKVAVPMMLAVGGVHTHLIKSELRDQTSIGFNDNSAYETHRQNCVFGVGADYGTCQLAERTISARHAEGAYDKGDKRPDLQECLDSFYHALHTGLAKTMSKMGVSTLSSYKQARLFEALGISQTILDEHMPGIPSPIGGMDMDMLETRLVHHHDRDIKRSTNDTLNDGGLFKARAAGEYHADGGFAIKLLQYAVNEGGDKGWEFYRQYTDLLERNRQEHPIDIPDLLNFKEVDAIPVEEVESEETIMARFMNGAMSLGALSPEAHDAITVAMNRLGAKSNSGEGGAKPEFYGTEHDPSVKQYASARFGVTAGYLMSADEIEIKIAQGAKPGEGGQLMGAKNHGAIPRLRHTKPGVTLISPPPHHDQYSIEDHAGVIYELKAINPEARVRTKLVSTTGVATIVSGVQKAGADTIHIAGFRGGTGASPKSSIKHTGMPWSIGLSSANQLLHRTGGREFISLSTDGGLRDGRGIVIAALLGAEEYSFGSLPMYATGCLLMRQCFSNKCAVGVATQDQKLRAKFPVLDGAVSPQEKAVTMVMNLFRYLARDVREQLAAVGYRSIDEAVGRGFERLEQVYGKHVGIDLGWMLENPNPAGAPLHSKLKAGERNEYSDPNHPSGVYFDEKILKLYGEEILSGRPAEITVSVTNTDRAVGARMAYHLRKAFSPESLNKTGFLAEDHVKINLDGIAGQGLGAFIEQGLTLRAHGANDGVGKSLSGGKIVISADEASPIAQNPQDNVLIGQFALFGATKGELFVAGKAGNRFAIRNSGGLAVVEGMQDNGCNYQTNGRIVCLGEVGHNFGAGMTGGDAFIYDIANTLEERANDDVVLRQITSGSKEEQDLKFLVEKHVRETGSRHGQKILDHWEDSLKHFKYVLPSYVPPPTPEVEETPEFALH